MLQEYRDILKLLGRQSVGPDASGWVFHLTPYVMVGVMLTIATALPVVTVDSPLPVLGDLITLIYLFAIARFFFAISGLDTGSPFTALGSSREAMLGVLVEPILLLACGWRRRSPARPISAPSPIPFTTGRRRAAFH